MVKKLMILTVLLVVVVAVAVALGGSGSELDALSCIRCGPAGGTTGAAWGMGATCAAATTNAIWNAQALIPTYCSSCSETVLSQEPCNTSCTNVATCYTPYGQWRVDVKIKYKCEVDLCQ
jgi:hypothetical protein